MRANAKGSLCIPVCPLPAKRKTSLGDDGNQMVSKSPQSADSVKRTWGCLLSAVTYHDIWDFTPLTQTLLLSLRDESSPAREVVFYPYLNSSHVLWLDIIRAWEDPSACHLQFITDSFSLLLTVYYWSEPKEPVVLKTSWKWSWLRKYVFCHLQLICINFETPLCSKKHICQGYKLPETEAY